jgi:hypothetical protein
MKISQRDYNKIKLNTSVTILKYQLSEANESQLNPFLPLRQLVLLDSFFRKSTVTYHTIQGNNMIVKIYLPWTSHDSKIGSHFHIHFLCCLFRFLSLPLNYNLNHIRSPLIHCARSQQHCSGSNCPEKSPSNFEGSSSPTR